MDGNKHTNHNDNDIIIRDQDGTYKILREGKFVPLDDAAAGHAMSSEGPKRAPAPAGVSEAKPVVPAPAKPVAPAPSKPAMPAVPASVPAVKPPVDAMPSTPPVRGMSDQDLLAKADAFIAKSGVNFASGEIRSRVAKALVAHIKQVRKPFETRQNLAKSVAEGGAGLAETDINAIMSAAGEQNGGSNGAVKPVMKPENPIVKPTNTPMVAIGKEISSPARVALDRVSADAPYFNVTKEQGKQAFSLPSASAPRPALSDVQRPTRATSGPIDELAYDLVTWRRLAPNPMDRIKKTEAQLDLLEQDGYVQRLRGIQAWRSSDVVKAYLLAEKQSLESSQALPDMLKQPSANQLTWEEWQAVEELNERLVA